MREHCPPYRGRRPVWRRSGTTKLKFYRGLPKKTDNPRGCGDSVKVCLLFGESGGMSDAEENPEYGYCKIPRQQKQRTVNPPSNAHVGSNPTSPIICRSSSMVERRTRVLKVTDTAIFLAVNPRESVRFRPSAPF